MNPEYLPVGENPDETIEETSKELMKQIMEKGGIEEDTPITMSGKQLNTLVVAVSASTAKVYTESINKLTANFKQEMITYISTEFLEDFKRIDDAIDALARIDKLEASIKIHTKFLDKHEKLLNTD